jgi:hypothetical protein
MINKDMLEISGFPKVAYMIKTIFTLLSIKHERPSFESGNVELVTKVITPQFADVIIGFCCYTIIRHWRGCRFVLSLFANNTIELANIKIRSLWIKIVIFPVKMYCTSAWSKSDEWQKQYYRSELDKLLDINLSNYTVNDEFIELWPHIVI